MSDWAEPEDFGAWGKYDDSLLIDSPDDIRETSTPSAKDVKACPCELGKEPMSGGAVETTKGEEAKGEEAKEAKGEAEAKGEEVKGTEAKGTEAKGTEAKSDAMSEETLLARTARMRQWFPSGTFDVPLVLAKEQRHVTDKSLPRYGSLVESVIESGAKTPLEALSMVAGKTIAQVSDMGSPIVQQYMRQLQ
jgi:hypothetical protein